MCLNMDQEINNAITISQEDVKFLKNLGFTEDIPDALAIEDGALTSYFMELKDHPFIDNLSININIEPGFIEVYGNDQFTPIIKKSFTRDTALAILEFLKLRD